MSKGVMFLMNRVDMREEAEAHRKAGRHQDALPLYDKLWESDGECNDGAGLLHCLRKLSQFDRLRDFSDKLYERCRNHDWPRLEIIWAYVSLIRRDSGETSLTEIVKLAERVMMLDPEELPLALTAFAVLRKAKEAGKWDIVQQWVDRLDPERLSKEPMVFDGREGWSQRALWYNYKINSELQAGHQEDAARLAQIAVPLFPRQHDFFQRLLAKALCLSGRLDEGLKLYRLICSNPRADWWLRHEYGQFLRIKGDKDAALAEMSQAALSSRIEPKMVRLIHDIGTIMRERGRLEDAQAHFVVVSELRQQAGWGVPEELLSDSDKIDIPMADALKACRKVWEDTVRHTERSEEKEFSGRITGLYPERKFCFVATDEGLIVFVSASLLDRTITSGSRVVCKAVPSWDKKKMQEGWRAVSVTPL